jgi:hypothetical protein
VESTDSQLNLTHEQLTTISLYLNQTIDQLGKAQANIASAQESIKGAQNSVSSIESNDALLIILVVASISIALVSLVMVLRNRRKELD